MKMISDLSICGYSNPLEAMADNFPSLALSQFLSSHQIERELFVLKRIKFQNQAKKLLGVEMHPIFESFTEITERKF